MAIYKRVEPVDGELVQYLGVYALDWPEGISPTVAFVEDEEAERKLTQYKAIAQDLRYALMMAGRTSEFYWSVMRFKSAEQQIGELRAMVWNQDVGAMQSFCLQMAAALERIQRDSPMGEPPVGEAMKALCRHVEDAVKRFQDATNDPSTS